MRPTFCIIGTGFIFPAHVEAIRHVGGRILEVVNTSTRETWESVIRHSKAEWVVVLTPNDLHVEMARVALAAGKQVLCEKPMALRHGDLVGIAKAHTVLQLRYHAEAERLRAFARTFRDVEMDIAVHRDEAYYRSWKGQPKRSGGVLMNLGVHYFDLLLWLFGAARQVRLDSYDDTHGAGFILGDDFRCRFRIGTDAPKEHQHRIFRVDGEQVNFSSQDNLSYENLHRRVYAELLKGRGFTAEDAAPSIRLINELEGVWARHSPIASTHSLSSAPSSRG